MKTILRGIAHCIIGLCSCVYGYGTHEAVKTFSNKMYSLWMRRNFGACGKGLCLRPPVYLIGGRYITIGDHFGALERFRIECWDGYAGERFTPRLTIGNNVAIGYNVHIGCINEIRIGNNVLLASNIFIEDCSHGFVDGRDAGVPPLSRRLYSKGPVIIEDDVWIGENVAVMPGVTIGRNAVVGANAVVTKDVPAFAVVAGNPARIIKSLQLPS